MYFYFLEHKLAADEDFQAAVDQSIDFVAVRPTTEHLFRGYMGKLNYCMQCFDADSTWTSIIKVCLLT